MERKRPISSEAQTLITAIAGVFVLAGISTLAFTTPQREWIRDRDGNKCNFPGHHNCNGKHGDNLQVHHIMPQRYCKELGIDPDFAENGVTICERSHQTMIHPDMKKARQNYGRNKNSYKEVFDERKHKLEQKTIYWVDKWDRALQATVYRNQQRYLKNGAKPFPENNHRN